MTRNPAAASVSSGPKSRRRPGSSPAGPLYGRVRGRQPPLHPLARLEVIRAVSFIVRDRDWGTYNPVISDLEVDGDARRLHRPLPARTADAAQAFVYEAEIVGKGSGRLGFSGRGRAVTDFVTNRTGFVVLHPSRASPAAGRDRACRRPNRREPLPRTDRSGAADDGPARS